MKYKILKYYIIGFIFCLLVYIWVYINIINYVSDIILVKTCIIKSIYKIPCPSCGTTRSIISITKGQFIEAFNFNPLGFFAIFFMMIIPIWILYDIIRKENTLLNNYKEFEKNIKKPYYAIPLICLIILNWIWNIYKGI